MIKTTTTSKSNQEHRNAGTRRKKKGKKKSRENTSTRPQPPVSVATPHTHCRHITYRRAKRSFLSPLTTTLKILPQPLLDGTTTSRGKKKRNPRWDGKAFPLARRGRLWVTDRGPPLWRKLSMSCVSHALGGGVGGWPFTLKGTGDTAISRAWREKVDSRCCFTLPLRNAPLPPLSALLCMPGSTQTS